MILSEISETIVINEILSNATRQHVHIVTHLSNVDSISVPPNWRSVIFTSCYIATILVNHNKIPLKYIKALELNKIYIHKMLQIALCGDEKISHNLILYIRGSNGQGGAKRIIYNGIFNNMEILNNQCISNILLKPIDTLYVESKDDIGESVDSIQNAGQKIFQLFQEYPNYQIILWLPTFGYDDLLLHLAKKFGFILWLTGVLFEISKELYLAEFLATTEISAHIIVTMNTVYTMDEVESGFRQKRIFVKLISAEKEPKSLYKDKGLYEINWSPYPTTKFIQSFQEHIRPRNTLFINTYDRILGSTYYSGMSFDDAGTSRSFQEASDDSTIDLPHSLDVDMDQIEWPSMILGVHDEFVEAMENGQIQPLDHRASVDTELSHAKLADLSFDSVSEKAAGIDKDDKKGHDQPFDDRASIVSMLSNPKLADLSFDSVSEEATGINKDNKKCHKSFDDRASIVSMLSSPKLADLSFDSVSEDATAIDKDNKKGHNQSFDDRTSICSMLSNPKLADLSFDSDVSEEAKRMEPDGYHNYYTLNPLHDNLLPCPTLADLSFDSD